MRCGFVTGPSTIETSVEKLRSDSATSAVLAIRISGIQPACAWKSRIRSESMKEPIVNVQASLSWPVVRPEKSDSMSSVRSMSSSAAGLRRLPSAERRRRPRVRSKSVTPRRPSSSVRAWLTALLLIARS